jgi:homoserine kinase
MKKKSTAARRNAFHISLPATSANLGPAFDAAALAMDLHISIDAIPAEQLFIRASGRDRAICEQLEANLILDTYREVLADNGREIIPVALRIRNDIPIGKGCGSSAAARLAGIALAVHFGGLRWSDAQIVAEASRREHHPDNASACWFGGLTVARMSDETVEVAQIQPKGKWALLLAIPDQALSTEAARRVLPAQYLRADTVANIQNSMLLLAAFTQGRHDLLHAALEDRIHQPYRAALCPLLPALKELSGKEGILGVALSGAGPSVLLFLHPKHSAAKVRKLCAKHLKTHGLKAELLITKIARRRKKVSPGSAAKRPLL